MSGPSYFDTMSIMTQVVTEVSPKVFLVVVRKDETRSLDLGRRFPIYSDSIHLGNTEEAEIPVGFGWTEQCHVHIYYNERSWHVHDLGNFNRVAVNGVSCEKFQINDGDLIQVGEVVFELSVKGGTKFEFFEENERTRQEDLLTKAYNRGYLYSVMQWEIDRLKYHFPSRRRGKSLIKPSMSLIMLDVDNYGDFNKKYDHQVGDEVLKGIVERTKSRVRTTDIVARWAGDEFMVYLPETGMEQALEVAQQIRKQIGQSAFRIGKKKLSVTVSVGVAEYESHMDLKAFVAAANRKVLDAKDQGRNRVVS